MAFLWVDDSSLTSNYTQINNSTFPLNVNEKTELLHHVNCLFQINNKLVHPFGVQIGIIWDAKHNENVQKM